MRVCEIIGKVTLSQWHPSLKGASWRLAVPLKLEGIEGKQAGRTEPIVIYDEIGGDTGMLVAIAEGPEASAPFHPEQKPIDGYSVAILDHIEVEN
ncbi:MAG: carbon dioxide concentrating mechanism protein CcmL [Planctomycetaceae bacterium]|nr:carbon dioxide concentrating mechanism protein CcmL [Planctomycetaceae bacterium]